MTTASIVVDLRNMRCGNCKVAITDALAEQCPTCGAKFDRIASNHAGLADKLRQQRDEAAFDCSNGSPHSQALNDADP
jgi:predicted  nucleic acid-binding Zn-ribbon protein